MVRFPAERRSSPIKPAIRETPPALTSRRIIYNRSCTWPVTDNSVGRNPALVAAALRRNARIGVGMGISKGAMAGVIREAKFRPLRGTAYTLGRQTMASTPAETNKLFDSLNTAPVGGKAKSDQIDTTTRVSAFSEDKPIRDVDFFKMLGLSEIKAIDVSDYEG